MDSEVATSIILTSKSEPEGGSDSGVEICYNSNILVMDSRSCDSASLLTMGYKAGDVTSENGSESSSYTSSNKSSSYRTCNGTTSKKRVSIATPTSSSASLSRSMTTSMRSRSSAREEKYNTPPDSLPLRSCVTKLRTPVSTPTSPCDGRWPSTNMKSSCRNALPAERSGTLPRSRRRTMEQVSNSSVRSVSASRDVQQNRKTAATSLRRTASHRARERVESSAQTTLTGKDFQENSELRSISEKLAITSLNGETPQNETTGISEATLQLVVDERDKLQQELKTSKIELDELRNLCRRLQKEKEDATMQQSQKLHDISLQQRALEEESSEMYDFLQAERSSMVQEMEAQKAHFTELKTELKYKTEILERQQKECRHLVRVSEQRRYENLALQSRLIQSRELLLQQGAMTSRAAVALVGLSNRLDTLVDSLAESYDISGNDLEELVFYNEAYTQSSGDDENISVKEHIQPSKNLQQNRKTFMSAITRAIRNSRDKRKSMKDEADPTDFLDSELEPELMMENVLEDVMMPNNHSQNVLASAENIESRNSGIMDEDLHNLSLAILDHQRSETEDLNIIDSFPDRMSDCFADLTLVDRVINIDNAVTKLLKILRIVQLENDSSTKQDERAVSVS